MTKIALKYGALSGLILAILFIVTFAILRTIESGYGVGFATMLISLSSIYYGIKSYRDAYPDQAITFWRFSGWAYDHAWRVDSLCDHLEGVLHNRNAGLV
jgi:hypothetical protein